MHPFQLASVELFEQPRDRSKRGIVYLVHGCDEPTAFVFSLSVCHICVCVVGCVAFPFVPKAFKEDQLTPFKTHGASVKVDHDRPRVQVHDCAVVDKAAIPDVAVVTEELGHVLHAIQARCILLVLVSSFSFAVVVVVCLVFDLRLTS